ncbi:LysR family transcriptional regulator [Roseobacter sp. YSTF-M11]|uniref:LysR family transcriptional regulator n=1 Tax=Roseobacter insulae TaxID=2859783 RepID=A0A9X1FWZ4_9RHOB|nr:LysR family transcriptional regulator [Roseobacter insulae]MBW4709188.1 LysR family transcriptional regulator [Roseobacter insulae]
MNLRALKIFAYVMEEGTLARAADRMHLSQSAASRQLSLLEQEFDITLFRRDQKRLIPTPYAERFYPEALRILAQIDELPTFFDQMASDLREPLRIVSQTRIANGLVLPALGEFAALLPAQPVKLEIHLRRDLARRIMNHRFDLCVSALPLPVENLDPERLGATRLCVALARDHPLATREVLGIRDLQGVPYIALDETTVLRRLIDREMERLNTPLSITHEVSVGAAAYRLVHRGLGFTFADPVSLDPELSDGIALVPWEQDLKIEFGYFVPMRSTANDAARAFGKILERRFAAKSGMG